MAKMTLNDNRVKAASGQQEQQVWLRTLDYIQQETIQLKNSLANIIKKEIDSTMLESIEYFQNEFLKKDTVIALLRHDIAKQNKTQGTDTGDKKTAPKQEKLRQDMEIVEKQFSKLKFDYYSFLAKSDN